MGEPTFRVTRLVEVRCPACGHVVSAATHVGGSAPERLPIPKPDDVTVCIECVAPLQFTAGIANKLGLKELDWSELDDDPETKADLEKTVRLMRENKKQ